jgi:hypothetical protein
MVRFTGVATVTTGGGGAAAPLPGFCPQPASMNANSRSEAAEAVRKKVMGYILGGGFIRSRYIAQETGRRSKVARL